MTRAALAVDVTPVTPVGHGLTSVGQGFSLAAASSKPVYLLDPLTDPRWPDFLSRHPRASVFHSRGWLEALRRTYGYEPFVLTTTAGGPLDNGLVVCRVKTWAARRLVSLPFSDHCDPLVDSPDAMAALVGWLVNHAQTTGWRSMELRPSSVTPVGQGFSLADHLAAGACFFLHTLDLRPSLTELFAAFNHSNTQRAIRRAEREGLTYASGTSDQLLRDFYALLRMSRRRHGLPPQPLDWFRNLLECMGDAATIHVASTDRRPIAAILTLRFKNALVYKYGGSNASFHSLGAMPSLFWHVIQDAKQQGLDELDLGRSDLDQAGLIAFKDHLGAARLPLNYYRWPAKPGVNAPGSAARTARRVIGYLPDTALDLTGWLLYRHLG